MAPAARHSSSRVNWASDGGAAPGAPGAADGFDEHPTARLPGEPDAEPPVGGSP